MEVLDVVVIGAGQAGLSSAYHLRGRGLSHVVLDANATPGGAWQHRADSLTMHDVHGIAALPGSEAPGGSAHRARDVLPAYFEDYEHAHEITVLRPVHVDQVTDLDSLLVTRAGDRTWTSRTLINATGTWSHPFVPHYPGVETFAGEQLHSAAYPGPERFRGRRTIVVGGGASAVQLLGEIALVTDTLWLTRRPPVWRSDDFTPSSGRAAVALVEERVRRGLPPASVVSATGLALRAQEQAAARRGAYDRRAMFAAVEPSGVRFPGGSFERADVILWATGFRPAVSHLGPLRVRSAHGGIQLDGTGSVADPRVQLVGYGPSASTIGANRAGRTAARGAADWIARSTAATA